MRNGIYTYYQGFHLQVTTIRDDDNRVMLNYKNGTCPFNDFVKSSHDDGTYYLIIDLTDLTNAYYVKTFGLFKGNVFQVFDVKYTSEQVVRIGTSNRDKFISSTGLDESHKDWYIYDIQLSELEEIWEERTPTFNLPMPEGLKKKESIKPYAG